MDWLVSDLGVLAQFHNLAMFPHAVVTAIVDGELYLVANLQFFKFCHQAPPKIAKENWCLATQHELAGIDLFLTPCRCRVRHMVL